MKNKLLATTAIVGLGLSGSAFAEVKIGGNIEYTGQFITGKTAADSKEIGGVEDNVQFKASKDTDFGQVSYGFKLENGDTEGAHVQFEGGSAVFQIGADAFQHLSGSAMPNIGESYSTVVDDFATGYEAVHDFDGTNYNAFGYALGLKGAGGMASIRYTPDSSAGNDQNANGVGSGTPTMTIMYKGNAGIEGLNLVAGTFKQEKGDGNLEGKGNHVGFGYNFGAMTVGAEYRTHEDAAATADQDEYKSTGFALGYALSDQVTASLTYIQTDGDNNGVDFGSKEKITGLGVGYNLGGVSLEVTYADVENIKGTGGSDGEVLQIRTVQKF